MGRKKTRTILCLSSKGGVGKTTTAINLAAALNSFGRETVLLDADLSTPNVGVYMGTPVVPVTLHDVLSGKASVEEALYLHHSGLKILPGSIAYQEAKNIKHSKISEVVVDLYGGVDFIIVDASPSMGKESLSVLKSVDEVIVITNPEMPAVTDALKTVKQCQSLGKHVLGFVVTKTNAKNPDLSLNDIQGLLEVPLLAIIPEDRAVKYAQAQKDAVVHVHPRSAASIQYKHLAADLVDEDYAESVTSSLYSEGSHIFDKVMKWLGWKE